MAFHEEASYTHLWQEGAALFGPAIRLMLLQMAAIAVLVTACLFYAGWHSWIGRIGALASGYALLLWAMMLLYQWPLLIAQEKGAFDEPDRRARRGAFAVIRRSFYMALGTPFFTAALLVILLLGSALMAATVVLPPLLWIGIAAIATTGACRAVLIQFGVLPSPVREEPIADLQFRIREKS